MFITRHAQIVASLFAVAACAAHPSRAAWAAAASESNTPEALASAKARAVTEELSTWVKEQRGQVSLYVGRAEPPKEIAAVNADLPLNPASDTKLLTMATALETLGPEWQFTASLCGVQETDSVETLGIVSNGDPTLDREAMTALAIQLLQRGVKRVTRVVVDQSAFDDKFTPPAFEQQPNEWAPFRAPVSAVAFNGNTVSLWVSPAEYGLPPRVVPFPPSFVDLVITARTGNPKDKLTPLEVAVSSASAGLRLKVSGTLPRRSGPVTVSRRIEEPSLFAGYAVADTLRSLGIQVATPSLIEAGSCKNQPVLAHRSSPPLMTVLQRLGKESDNFTAEMLVKAIGARVTSKPGATADGIEVIRQWAARIHPLAAGTQLINGSGLFDANRVSAEQFAAVLRYMRNNPRTGPEFITSLSVAARDGTLRRRLEKQSRAVVRAKTGTLNHVVALSGYIESPGLEPWVFSVLLNGVESPEPARRKLDAYVLRLIDVFAPSSHP